MIGIKRKREDFESGKNIIDIVPYEILCLISSFLDSRSFIRLNQTCRSMKTILSKELISRRNQSILGRYEREIQSFFEDRTYRFWWFPKFLDDNNAVIHEPVLKGRYKRYEFTHEMEILIHRKDFRTFDTKLTQTRGIYRKDYTLDISKFRYSDIIRCHSYWYSYYGRIPDGVKRRNRFREHVPFVVIEVKDHVNFDDMVRPYSYYSNGNLKVVGDFVKFMQTINLK